MDAKNDGFPAVEVKGTTAQAVPPCVSFGKFLVYELSDEFFQRTFLLEKDDLALTLHQMREFVREQTKR
jgi:hypothetical protein